MVLDFDNDCFFAESRQVTTCAMYVDVPCGSLIRVEFVPCYYQAAGYLLLLLVLMLQDVLKYSLNVLFMTYYHLCMCIAKVISHFMSHELTEAAVQSNNSSSSTI